ncbi:type III-B CRISPR module-associated protein Cmr3 [Dehalococcoidia bacterium]|nr:type III-B CRISPR module-associated protein Cmr3 [Dehalococcoidia bacterium]MCL0056556.1 type III-B CRISPR module-associated protein Cmr3 [Dehalococcoidia bacterium]MCL0091005.1 type III-B CRISPR module-associated protein Cmr3 [Dehalococcoidia bacterium]MCL0098489.1 type III-B CRISPR module-associated protein Cmr3 [Dehalococcoidia bacterium]
MKWFFIRPFDTLFFRDARPFAAGEDNLGQSLFPPAPSVTYGAIRTASLSHADVDLIDFKSGKAGNVPPAAGTKTTFGTLHLTGPIPAWRQDGTVELLFRSPLNLVYKEASRDHDLEFLLPGASSSLTNLRLSLSLCVAQEKVACTDRYLRLDQALALLAGIFPKTVGDLTRQEDFWKSDDRVGIARTKARTAEEGMLFSSRHIQIDNHPQNKDQAGGLVVKVLDGENDLPLKCTIQLGGEKRFCEFEEISLAQPTEFQLDRISKKISETQRFFLWLISPAMFSHNEFAFIPGFIDPNTLRGRLEGQEVKLVACQVDRAVGIGGWNIAENTHKPMRRAVPAGSIYFFELSNNKAESIEQFVRKWMLRPITGQISDYERQGFGTILIGGY